MTKTVQSLGEFSLIDIFKSPTRSKAMISIGDDTAVLPLNKDKYQLWTTDMLIEGVHFKKTDDPIWIGHKALACSLSDIAAMGGRPSYALLSLGISPRKTVAYVKKIRQGFERLSQAFNVDLVGGDTVKSEKLILNVTVLGEVPKKYLTLRSKARVGDLIYVSGPLGKSLPTKAHLQFQPRLREAQYLVSNYKIHSMIDCSDGLAGDLGHILKESSCGARLLEELIPRRERATVKQALYDGEDFELIFTLSAKEAERLERQKKFVFYPIGEITSKGFTLVNSRGKKSKITMQGFTHF